MVAHCSCVRSDNSLQACSLEEKSSVPELLVLEKNCFQGKETRHAGMSGKLQGVIAETDGGGYQRPGLLYQTLDDLYECSQYYLVNK